MPSPTDELIERLASLSGTLRATEAASWANDLSPWETNSIEWALFIQALMGSVDSAIALVERCGWRMHRMDWFHDHVEACIFEASLKQHPKCEDGLGCTQALAVLSALLRALKNKEGGGNE